MFKQLVARILKSKMTPYTVVVRHAHPNGPSGDDSRSLSDAGRKQSRETARVILERFNDQGYEFRVFASRIVRAYETAEIIATELGVTAEVVPWLNDDMSLPSPFEVITQLQTLPNNCVPVLVTHAPQVAALTGNMFAQYAEPTFRERRL